MTHKNHYKYVIPAAGLYLILSKKGKAKKHGDVYEVPLSVPPQEDKDAIKNALRTVMYEAINEMHHDPELRDQISAVAPEEWGVHLDRKGLSVRGPNRELLNKMTHRMLDLTAREALLIEPDSERTKRSHARRAFADEDRGRR